MQIHHIKNRPVKVPFPPLKMCNSTEKEDEIFTDPRMTEDVAVFRINHHIQTPLVIIVSLGLWCKNNTFQCMKKPRLKFWVIISNSCGQLGGKKSSDLYVLESSKLKGTSSFITTM